jgi:hypothetical protein
MNPMILIPALPYYVIADVKEAYSNYMYKIYEKNKPRKYMKISTYHS